MDAIEYPSISIGGRELIVRFNQASILLLIRAGLDPDTVGPSCDPTKTPQARENLFKVFAACVAENYVDKSDPSRFTLAGHPSAEWWATQVEYGDLGRIDKAVGMALKKAQEAQKARAAVLPIAS